MSTSANAQALDHLAASDDLAVLAHDLGFSSHSHFAAMFQQVYRRTTAAFRRDVHGGERRISPARG